MTNNELAVKGPKKVNVNGSFANIRNKYNSHLPANTNNQTTKQDFVQFLIQKLWAFLLKIRKYIEAF